MAFDSVSGGKAGASPAENPDGVSRIPYVGGAGRRLEGPSDAATLGIGFVGLSLAVGFVIGCAVSAVMALSTWLTNLVWVSGASAVDVAWYPLAVCTLGGLIIGLWTRLSGNRIQDLETVLEQFKKTGRYDLHGAGRSVVSFLLPLTFGGSVGFEAGLTGIIVAGCCWIRDRLKAAGLRVAHMTDVTVAASLSAIFGAPLAGLVADMETRPVTASQALAGSGAAASAQAGAPGSDKAPQRRERATETMDAAYDLRKGTKLALYLTAAIGAFAGARLVASLTGGAAGLPRFETIQADGLAVLWALPCLLAAYVLTLVYHFSDTGFAAVARHMGTGTIATVAAPVIAGLVLGGCALAYPYVLFPGEEQCHELMGSWQSWTAVALVATGLIKAAATPMCIRMGWMGGAFFPCIFAGVACGYGIAILTGADPMLAVTVTTSAFLAGVTRKPILSVGILALCFPLTGIIYSGLAAIVGSAIPLPARLCEREDA